MGTDGTTTVDRPPVTPTGLTALLAQLDADLAQVQASAADPATKARVKNQIGKMKEVLEGADAADAGAWVLFLAPQFALLTTDLVAALGGGAGDTGACFYSNPAGCIQSTRAQCTQLGGSFHPNTACV